MSIANVVPPSVPVEELYKTFKAIDTRKDGFIDIAEITEVLKQTGLTSGVGDSSEADVLRKECKEFMTLIAAENPNLRITFDEFRAAHEKYPVIQKLSKKILGGTLERAAEAHRQIQRRATVTMDSSAADPSADVLTRAHSVPSQGQANETQLTEVAKESVSSSSPPPSGAQQGRIIGNSPVRSPAELKQCSEEITKQLSIDVKASPIVPPPLASADTNAGEGNRAVPDTAPLNSKFVDITLTPESKTGGISKTGSNGHSNVVQYIASKEVAELRPQYSLVPTADPNNQQIYCRCSIM
eukprot:GILK01013647.1.p1 GENE.GILK01013647.1~~GILK01013647.1.p1  ORF type:complete len:298 (+),score=59.84 GILK01013647.1:88-981(+)